VEKTGYVKVKNPKQPSEFLWLHHRDFKPPWELWEPPPPASAPEPEQVPEPEVRAPRPRRGSNKIEAYDIPQVK
jgi:hypothetical protein